MKNTTSSHSLFGLYAKRWLHYRAYHKKYIDSYNEVVSLPDSTENMSQLNPVSESLSDKEMYKLVSLILDHGNDTKAASTAEGCSMCSEKPSLQGSLFLAVCTYVSNGMVQKPLCGLFVCKVKNTIGGLFLAVCSCRPLGTCHCMLLIGLLEPTDSSGCSYYPLQTIQCLKPR